MTDPAPFKDRRERFMQALGGGLAVVPAAAEAIRNRDVHHDFRQDSDFFHLTGFDEPDAVAVFNPSRDGERYVLFVRPRDRDREVWDGYRAGPEGAVERYGADASYPLAELDVKLREYARGADVIHYRLGGRLDDAVHRTLEAGRALRGFGTVGPTTISDPSVVLHELRLHKSQDELDTMRRACEMTAEGHAEAMRFTRPGLYEYQVQAALELGWRMSGSRRNGYPSIVGSGPNACVLHYNENSRRIEDGDLVLIDAAAEYGYFSSDITRTFPANGRFAAAQREVYELVLAALETATREVRTGARYGAVTAASTRVLAEGLVEMGAVPLGLRDTLAMHHYSSYTVHGVGHVLGRDVHDVGSLRQDGVFRGFAEGLVMTVEPGLYFPPDQRTVTFHLLEYDLEERARMRVELGQAEAERRITEAREKAEKIEHTVPERLLGIGIRIEDDVLVTAGGNDILTASCPKTIEDVEATCGESSRLPAA